MSRPHNATSVALQVIALCAIASVSVANIATASSPRRQVDCTHANKDIQSGQLALYELFFSDMHEVSNKTTGLPIRVGRTTVNFETLAGFASAGSTGADVGEFAATVGAIEARIDPANVSFDATVEAWTEEWTRLAEALEAEGHQYADEGDQVSAASALFRASTAFQMVERFASDHMAPDAVALYNRSVQAFDMAVMMDTPQTPRCDPIRVPYFKASASDSVVYLPGYWCPAARTSRSASTPTALAFSGYDGSAQGMYHEVARAATAYGYNVLIFEGPGQGWAARELKLQFRVDWEAVVTPALDFAASTYGVDPSTTVLWGRSFGGFLAPRAFAHEPRLAAVVADGGVMDFYQGVVCGIPDYKDFPLRTWYYQRDAKFDNFVAALSDASLSSRFALSFGALGFGVSTLAELLDAFSDYALTDAEIANIAGRPVFMNDPPLDGLMGNQSSLLWAAMHDAVDTGTTTTAAVAATAAAEASVFNPKSMLHVPPVERGGALHCSVGSSQNANIAVMRWLNSALGIGAAAYGRT